MDLGQTVSGVVEPTSAVARAADGRIAVPVPAIARVVPDDGSAAPALSREARRIRDGLGIPMTALPGVEREERAYLYEHSKALNRLIVGEASTTGVWGFLREHLPLPLFDELRARFRPAFSPLWDRSELAALEEKDLRGLEAEWRARMAAHPRWAETAEAIREEPDYAELWRDVLGGDFDLRGRGAEYTAGMESFQASRWLGARTLLRLLGARDSGRGIYLDVLGGDGYVWRLLEAEKGVAEVRLVIVEDERFFPGEGLELPDPARELMRALSAVDERVAVLLVGAGERGRRTFRARLLLARGGELVVSGPFSTPGEGLQHLVAAREAVWLSANGSAAALVESAAEAVAASRERDGGSVVVTNDISPHMFYRAGIWGLPTREDATRLSRTFLPDSVDGVLFAYGTHHIPDMFRAVREAYAVVKPEGTVLIHDFFDEGPAGQWFHRVVDRHSKTGHDIPHIGPIQMAVVLFRAGFRGVTLHETQDPFFFACEGPGERAPDLALSYLLGMYGMAESFAGRLDEFEEVVRSTFTYPEVGEVPVFTEEFVYVPRRAVVARARKPAASGAELTEEDRVLVRGVSALFRMSPDEVMERAGAPEGVREYWFGEDGSRWNVPPEQQREWLEWAEAVP